MHLLPTKWVLLLTVLVQIVVSSSVTEDIDLKILGHYQELISDSDGRSAWTGRKQSSQCRGAITKLKKDEATVLKSHFGYGKQPYPEDYQCRWLFIPDDCNLGIECSLGTNYNRRRGRTSQKCIGGDYLRVLGYRGTTDKFFCGSRGFNLTFAGNDSVALMFKSRERKEQKQRQNLLEGLASLFQGFNCKVVCKNPDSNNNVHVPTTSTIKPTTTSTTTTAKSAKTTPSSRPVTSKTPDGKPRLNCKCGETRKGRIVCPKGENCTADLGSIPWQAAIVNKRRSQPWCGGAIINDRYVLTAAHCMVGKRASKIQVILGEHDWTTKSETQEDRYDVDKIIIHPRAGDQAQFDYDFALLRLVKTIGLNRKVRPVCLPDMATRFVEKDFFAGQFAQVSGWGVTDPNNPRRQARKLKKVSVRVMTDSECKGKYTYNPITPSMMCAAFPERDACFGDSGGPMTIQDQGVHVLEGVISWGKNCAKPQWPGVYARVRFVLPWIMRNTEDSLYCENGNRGNNIGRRHVNTEDLFFFS